MNTHERHRPSFLTVPNSIFYGDKLLTAANPEAGRDAALFKRLGLPAT